MIIKMHQLINYSSIIILSNFSL